MAPIADIAKRAASYLRSSAGLPAEGIRFSLAGGFVALTSLATTITLADGVGLPFQLALALAVVVALTLHFTLQRLFVWKHHGDFALELHQQVWRYLAVAGAQYAATALITATVPKLLGVPVIPVYVSTLVVIAVLNFLIFRRIFHAFRADF